MIIGVSNTNLGRRSLSPYPLADLEYKYSLNNVDGSGNLLPLISGTPTIPKVSGTGLDTIYDFSVLSDNRFDKSNATYWGSSLNAWFYYNPLRPFDAKLPDFHYRYFQDQMASDNNYCFAQLNYIDGVLVDVGSVLIYSNEQMGSDLNRLYVYAKINSLNYYSNEWIVRDDYSDILAAGSVDGTYSNPTGGIRAVVDSENKLSIDGNTLVLAGGKTAPAYTDPRLNYPTISRRMGKMLAFKITLPTADKHIRLGLGSNSTDINGEGIIHFANNGVINCFSSGTINTAASTYTAGTYNVAIILKDIGAYWFIKGENFIEWTLLWNSNTGNSLNLTPSVFNYQSAALIDDFRILDLFNGFSIENGIATDVIETVNIGDEINTLYNSFVEFTWEAETNEILEISIRYTDADNRWIVRCDQANSTIKIIEIFFGIETERNSLSQTWNTGSSYRIVIRTIDEMIRTYVNGAQKNTYSLAFNNKYIGKAKVSHAGVNLISYPIHFNGDFYPLSSKDNIDVIYKYNMRTDPVIEKRAAKWDAWGTREICILKDESGNTVYDDNNKMTSYYWGRETQSGVPSLGIAKSLDGVIWGDRLDIPMIPANVSENNSWYELGVNASSAIKRDDGLIMILSTGWGDSGTSFGLFTSNDNGATWIDGGALITASSFQNEDDSPLTGMGVPDVIKKSSGGYICLFEGRKGAIANKWRIYAMESDNFLSGWVPLNDGYPVFEPNPLDWDSDGVANPHLIEKTTGNYLMIYNGISLTVGWRIGIAETTDFSTWNRHQDNPIIHNGNNVWDSVQTETCGLIKDLFPAKIYFQGYAATGAHEIGLAESY